MITLDNVSYKIGNRILFEHVNCTFRAERYGLTGPNGAGKSTLFKIIMKQLPTYEGTISLPAKIGYLRQDIHHFSDYNVIDCIIMGNRRLFDAITKKDSLYSLEFTDEIGFELGQLEDIINEEDGYMAHTNAETLARGLGIPGDFYDKKMHQIPLDMQFKALLAQALFGNPSALLLDEPTNHLDFGSIDWLENFLKQYTGVLIVISHNKHFLNTVTNFTADIDYETVTVYPGNYDTMVSLKVEKRSQIETSNKFKEKKIAQLQRFVDKFKAGTRSSQVQSRIKEIDRMSVEELKKSNIARPYIVFKPIERASGIAVCKLNRLSMTFDLPVIADFSLEIARGDKIGVIGNNGLGKTTLLKLIAKKYEPSAGKVSYGNNVLPAYFPQNHDEIIDKSEDITLFDWLKTRLTGVYDQQVRNVLGKLLFSGDDAFKKISKLSGGESARLILAYIMLTDTNFLIFDEPNNHLDLESVSALANALKKFPGTLITVSHDRDLIAKVATKLVTFEKVESSVDVAIFNGTLDEYLTSKVR